MRIKDLKNGKFSVEVKGVPLFYVDNYDAAIEIAWKLGGCR
ncbi:MAG: hypothetical protein ACRCW9_05495 [Cetobacterium sp.]